MGGPDRNPDKNTALRELLDEAEISNTGLAAAVVAAAAKEGLHLGTSTTTVKRMLEGGQPHWPTPRLVAAVLAETLRGRLVENLVAAGAVSANWRAAFETVPRHAFIPDITWHHGTVNGRRGLLPRHRTEDPDAWLTTTYQDDSIITQVDDGAPSGPGDTGILPTSSASMPTMVAVMLAALDVHDGHRVLEIGTGSGYNAALLAYRLGAPNITTIEIDPTVADAARDALGRAGYGKVTVVTADGTQGHPSHAPYDRVLSTASCLQVPYPWVAQTVPGGKVLTPWATPYYPGGLLELAGHRGAMLTIGLRVPQCCHQYFPYDPDDGVGELWFLDPWSGSWASRFHVTPDASDDEFSVRQRGPRRLWDEVCAAHTWWVQQGRPDEPDWLFTVHPDQQTIDLTAREPTTT